MKKFLFALLLAFPLIAFGQMNSTVISTTIQPAKSIPGTSIAYTGGYYTIPSSLWAKGAELSLTGTNGVLMVHLVKDPTSQYYPMPLKVGERSGAIFDKIKESGTTVDESKVWLFINE